MQPITYRPFLVWARNRPSELKILGDAAAKFQRSDDLAYRWAQVRAACDNVCRHLDHLMVQSAQAEEGDTETLESEILELVNAPIDTGMVVARETRDQAWLMRAHALINLLATVLSGDFALVQEGAEQQTEEERTIEELDAEDPEPPAADESTPEPVEP